MLSTEGCEGARSSLGLQQRPSRAGTPGPAPPAVGERWSTLGGRRGATGVDGARNISGLPDAWTYRDLLLFTQAICLLVMQV